MDNSRHQEGYWEDAAASSLSAEKAWATLLGAVLVWDMACPPGETLSEGVDRLVGPHPILTRAAIGYTALHLMNLLPPQLDLFHQATRVKSWF